MNAFCGIPDWQNTHFTKKNLTSLLLSSLILTLILTIPVNISHRTTAESTIFIELIKDKAPTQIIKKQSLAIPHTIIEEHDNNHKIKAKNKAKEKPKSYTEKTKKNHPIRAKKEHEQSSAWVLLNSIKNHKNLKKVTPLFQAESDIFISKSYVKPKKKMFILKNKYAENIKVNDLESLFMGGLRKSLSFFAPMDIPERTVDSIPYCVLLGRRSFLC